MIPAEKTRVRGIAAEPVTESDSFAFVRHLPPDDAANLSSYLKGLNAQIAHLRAHLEQLGRGFLQAADAMAGEASFHDSTLTGSASSLVSVANECLTTKARAGVRARYLTQLRSTLSLFCKGGRGIRPVATVSAAEIEDWLHAGKWAPRTQRGYLTDLRTLFTFAKDRGHVRLNPADAVPVPIVEEAPPCIHTPDQVRKVMETAAAHDRDVMRILAIQYFAGLRPAEAQRLTEASILPGHIEVTAKASKTRQRRLVTITPTLRAWLDQGGCLPVKNLTKRWRRIRELAKVRWGHDVTRHSFASYHLAEFRNADATSFELGHRDTQMLFRHYRELVTAEDANAFWEIAPHQKNTSV